MTAVLDSPFVAHMERYHPDSVTARLAVECRRLRELLSKESCVDMNCRGGMLLEARAALSAAADHLFPKKETR